MLEEPWITFLLIVLAVIGVLGGAFFQDSLSARAARRRAARDAAAHSAE